ncbi:MAG TPA: TonB-dependent siderophore receptor [Bordetella sp.]
MHLALAGGLLAARQPAAHAQAAAAQPSQALAARAYDIPSGPLEAALTRFVTESGMPLAATPGLVQGKQSPGLHGTFGAQAALNALLAGTGLEAVVGNEGSYVLRQAPAETSGAGIATLPAIAVTGVATVDLPPVYAGGQVASGGQLGFLGNRSIFDTPFNQSSYTSQLIQDQQARSIADVAANDPSVRQAWVSGSYTDQFYIRGFPVGASDVAVNGIFGLAPFQYSNTDWVDRVEILKGTNALLNGMSPGGSVGGNINLVPKQAEDTPITQLTTSYMSRGQLGTNVDIGRRFGTNQEWGIRFDGTYKNGDTSRDSQRQELGSAFLGLDYRGERFRMSLDAGYQHQDFASPTRFTYLGAGVQVPSAPDGSNNWEPSWTYVKSDDTFGLIHGEYDLTNNWTLYGSFGARRNDFKGVYGQSTITDSTGDFTGTYYTQPTWAESYSGQIGVRGHLTTGPVEHDIDLGYSNLDWNFGGLLTYLPGTYSSNIYSPVSLSQPDLSSVNLHVFRTSHILLRSYAFADTLSILDKRVQLTLGGRYQEIGVENFDQNTGILSSSYDRRALTPAVGLVVKPWQKVSLYANYIEGLQQGPTAPTGSTNVGEVFAPIKSRQMEAGVKVDFGHIGTTLSVFQIKQPSGITNPTTFHYDINGEQRNRGVEFNTFGEVYPGVRILGGVAFIDAQMTKTAGGTLDGKRPVGVPTFQANIGAEWDTPFVKGLTLSTRLVHTNGAYVDSTNTRATSGWERVDIGARYTFHRSGGKTIILRAGIDNIFNKNYWSATQFGMLELGEPRTYRLSATFDF